MLALLTLGCACSGSSAGTPPPLDAGAANGGIRSDASTGGSRVGHAASGGSDSGDAGGAGGASGAGSGGKAAAGGAADEDASAKDWWRPTLGSSWQIQYAETLDTSVDVQIYDIDLVDNSAEKIAALQAQGRKVICYFDTAYEGWRPDAKALEPYKGNALDGWPDQYWVDIRQAAVFEVMLKRLDLAKTKHCDGVDPDDVDARSNNPGFPFTAQDQQTFIKKIADAAHARGLAVGLKNDLEEIGALLDHVDFAVNEECFDYEECKLLMPFIVAGKPVFNVEYTDGDMQAKSETICPVSKDYKFSTLIKRLNLNAERYACK
jgi:hypothetical protein